MNERTAEQKIAAMRRVSEFLADDAVIECLGNMKWKCYDDFLTADSNEKRIIAQAQARNLESFADELTIVRDRGTVEVLKIAEAEARAKKGY